MFKQFFFKPDEQKKKLKYKYNIYTLWSRKWCAVKKYKKAKIIPTHNQISRLREELRKYQEQNFSYFIKKKKVQFFFFLRKHNWNLILWFFFFFFLTNEEGWRFPSIFWDLESKYSFVYEIYLNERR